MKTVQQCIDWLWHNNAIGGQDFDGIWGKQCVDLPKGLIQFCGVPSWNKSRGDGVSVVSNLYSDGLVTKDPVTQNRIKIVSVSGGGSPAPYGHVFVVVDETVFEQNSTQAVSLQSVKQRGYSQWVEGYPNFIQGTQSKPVVKGSTATVLAIALNVRDKATIKGNVVATYTKGQKIYNVKYHSIADGYVWYTYVSASGLTRYVSAGKYTQSVSPDDLLKIDNA